MKKQRTGKRRYLVGIAIVVVFLVVFIWPAMQGARPAMLRTTCRHNLHQLSIAMHAYHNVHNAFPPAVVYDADGKPMHSWRALILPYLENNKAGQDYDFAQPWNSSHNLAVADKLDGELFGCPAARERTWWGGVRTAETRFTNYVAVTGPNTIFADNEGMRLGSITDGASRTVLLMEFANSDIQLLEPRDLTAQHFIGAISRLQFSPGSRSASASLKCVLSRHPAGVNIALADGSTKCISRTTNIDAIKALTTRAGGETDIDF